MKLMSMTCMDCRVPSPAQLNTMYISAESAGHCVLSCVSPITCTQYLQVIYCLMSLYSAVISSARWLSSFGDNEQMNKAV